MSGNAVVVTGARSRLGQALIRALSPNTDIHVTGLVSTRRARESESPLEAGNVAYVVQDLRQALSPEAARAVRAADRIVHLAWSREGALQEMIESNLLMAGRLLEPRPGHGRLVFASSVAASARARSDYGRAKHRVQQRVLEAGGTAVVCGLVVGDPPETAFKMLVDALARMPVGVRLVPNEARVYPVLKDELVEGMAYLASSEASPGAYRAFVEGGVSINEFLEWTARRTGSDKPSLPVPFFAVPLAMRAFRIAGLRNLSDKLGTFFFKDDAALRDLLELPEAILRGTEGEFGASRRQRG